MKKYFKRVIKLVKKTYSKIRDMFKRGDRKKLIRDGRALEEMEMNSSGWKVVKEYLEEQKQSAEEALVDEESVEQIRVWQHNIRYYNFLMDFIEQTIQRKDELLKHLDKYQD